MKIPFAIVLASWFALPSFAGESGLIRTFQPLDATGAGWISIEQVTCYVSNFDAREVSAIEYISTKNLPPTRSEKGSGDLNLASTSNIYFDWEAAEGKAPKLFMGADRFVATRSFPREEILKASLECLRRVLPDKLVKTELTFSSSPENHEWIGKIVSEFNHCDKSKEFYKAKEP
jgi:hypothetical protein